ncbi:hypothetical protein GCM10011491_35310 [Brucella endophytica]|uniref:DUF2384 domain-containing protein n=1 Tax=Brucella endophytica TaxID=1963359 RepID=A0A916SMT8_9HYPH|nr:hypothetical protein [Brucella endophytica]GGB04137.1 hypothetical protein GCM10011491_35310 [Brucella endophytica]
MTMGLRTVPATAGRLSRHWRNDAARQIAVEVELALRRQKVAVTSETLDVAGKLAAQVLIAVTSLSPEHRSAVESAGKLLPDAIFRLILALAMEIDERQEQVPFQNEMAGHVDAEATSGRRRSDARFPLMQSWAGEVAGQTFIENELKIPRSTLHLWKRRNEVIALPKGRRTHVFPLAQFVDGRPVDGISRVLKEIQNPRTAWLWLVTPCDMLREEIPLNLLKQGKIIDVANAAAHVHN